MRLKYLFRNLILGACPNVQSEKNISGGNKVDELQKLKSKRNINMCYTKFKNNLSGKCCEHFKSTQSV